MGAKEDFNELLDKLGVPEFERQNYVIPIDLATHEDADVLAAEDIGAAPDFEAGYEEGYAQALKDHGIDPSTPIRKPS